MDPEALFAKKMREIMGKFEKIPRERRSEILRYCLENYPTPGEQFKAFRVLMMKEIAKNEVDKGGK